MLRSSGSAFGSRVLVLGVASTRATLIVFTLLVLTALALLISAHALLTTLALLAALTLLISTHALLTTLTLILALLILTLLVLAL